MVLYKIAGGPHGGQTFHKGAVAPLAPPQNRHWWWWWWCVGSGADEAWTKTEDGARHFWVTETAVSRWRWCLHETTWCWPRSSQTSCCPLSTTTLTLALLSLFRPCSNLFSAYCWLWRNLRRKLDIHALTASFGWQMYGWLFGWAECSTYSLCWFTYKLQFISTLSQNKQYVINVGNIEVFAVDHLCLKSDNPMLQVHLQ